MIKTTLSTLAGTLAIAIMTLPASSVLAQQAPAAKPDPRVAMGGYHPERMDSQGLAPHVAPVTITAPESIPFNRLQVPAGFKVELWAHGSPGARMMTLGDKGTVFQGTRAIGRVYAIREKDGKRVGVARVVDDEAQRGWGDDRHGSVGAAMRGRSPGFFEAGRGIIADGPVACHRAFSPLV